MKLEKLETSKFKKMINYIKSKLTMKFERTLFTDIVDGKKVCLFTDCFGDEWMANTKFGFRVKCK